MSLRRLVFPRVLVFLCCGGRVGRGDTGKMLLFISTLSCVWIWLQVAKSIFSFCGRHRRRLVYLRGPATSAACVTCGSRRRHALLPGKEASNESAVVGPTESGKRPMGVKLRFTARSQTSLRMVSGFREGLMGPMRGQGIRWNSNSSHQPCSFQKEKQTQSQSEGTLKQKHVTLKWILPLQTF